MNEEFAKKVDEAFFRFKEREEQRKRNVRAAYLQSGQFKPQAGSPGKESSVAIYVADKLSKIFRGK